MAMDILVMRGIERLAIVLIGGMAIYLGYRLFLAVKAEAEGEAKITLPHDVTVMVSRVGPGVFFALFGSMVVIASLYFSIAYSDPERDYSGMVDNLGFRPELRDTAPALSAVDSGTDESLELARVGLRQEIEFLNRLPGLLGSSLSERQQETVARRVREIKLRLMSSVWAEDWGDSGVFRLWAEGGAPAELEDAGDQEDFDRARQFYEAGGEPAT
jgi:hypothetical protein